MNPPVSIDEIPAAGLLALLQQLKLHRNVKWEAADYEEGDDGREEAPALEDAEAASSLRHVTTFDGEEDRYHAVLLDLDVPAWLIPSSTPGHSHLYVDLHCHQDDYFEFLEAAVKVGLVEEGYVGACESRGATSLRLPWVRKGSEATR